MDMRMASRMAVPPRESMRASPSCKSLGSLVKSLSRKASSLKLTMKTSSWGLESFTKASAAASTLVRFSRMLPLLSITSPMETGTSSRLNTLICWGTPFSKTWKAFSGRFTTKWPVLSTTVACNTTSRVSTLITVVCPGVSAAHRPKAAKAHSADVRILLLSGSIVAQSPEGPKGRQPARLHQFNLDAPVLAIPILILRRVADDILIAQFNADLLGDVGELVEVFHGEVPAAGLFGDFAQQAGPAQFFRCTAACGGRLEDADCVNLNIRFAHQVLDFRFGVAAVVVAAVGDDQQRLAGVLGLLHMMQGQIHGVEQRGLALRLGEGKTVLDFLEAGCKFDRQVGAVAEFHQEKLIVGISRLEELSHRLARFFQFVSHAAAAIENDADRQGSVFTRELHNLLLGFILEETEIFLFQACDEPVQRIGDGDRNQHQRGVHANVALGQHRTGSGRFGARSDGNLRVRNRLPIRLFIGGNPGRGQ